MDNISLKHLALLLSNIELLFPSLILHNDTLRKNVKIFPLKSMMQIVFSLILM